MKKGYTDDFFNHLIKGMDTKLQAQLNYMYAHNRMQEEMNRRHEMEQMKREITEEVMSRVAIRIEDEAIKQLRDLLHELGN